MGDRTDEVVPVVELQCYVNGVEYDWLCLEAEDGEGLAEGESASRWVRHRPCYQCPRRAALGVRRKAPRPPPAVGYRPRLHRVGKADNQIPVAEGGYCGKIIDSNRNQSRAGYVVGRRLADWDQTGLRDSGFRDEETCDEPKKGVFSFFLSPQDPMLNVLPLTPRSRASTQFRHERVPKEID